MLLKDKAALITGGGRGIGKAIALAYAREGARIAICARTVPEIEDMIREARSLGAECLGFQCDVSSEESVKRLLENVEEKFDRLDVLVNNAG